MDCMPIDSMNFLFAAILSSLWTSYSERVRVKAEEEDIGPGWSCLGEAPKEGSEEESSCISGEGEEGRVRWHL